MTYPLITPEGLSHEGNKEGDSGVSYEGSATPSYPTLWEPYMLGESIDIRSTNGRKVIPNHALRNSIEEMEKAGILKTNEHGQGKLVSTVETSESGYAEAPPSFYCQITHEIMRYPVVTSDGHSFELDAIMKWLEEHDTSPVTGISLSVKTPDYPNGSIWMSSNYALQKVIVEWVDKAKKLSPEGTAPPSIYSRPSSGAPDPDAGATSSRCTIC